MEENWRFIREDAISTYFSFHVYFSEIHFSTILIFCRFFLLTAHAIVQTRSSFRTWTKLSHEQTSRCDGIFWWVTNARMTRSSTSLSVRPVTLFVVVCTRIYNFHGLELDVLWCLFYQFLKQFLPVSLSFCSLHFSSGKIPNYFSKRFVFTFVSCLITATHFDFFLIF